MRPTLVTLALLAAVAAAAAVALAQDGVDFDFEKYRGQQVLRCALKDNKDVEDFEHLHARFNLDVWSHRYSAGSSVDVRGTLASLAAVSKRFLCEVYAADVAELLKAEALATQQHLAKRGSNADFFDAYHNLDELLAYYKDLATRFPNLATWVPSIGKSYEGRDMPVIRIKGQANPTKTIWISAGIHAREWVSPATVAYITTKLLEGYGVDNTTTTIVNRFEIVVAPDINPDGYVHSWASDRLWRKNRRINSGSSCIGVDLNRNFDNHWGGVGASANPCAEDYRGASAASESETKAVQNYVLTLRNRATAIDFHAYGQLILRSYGYTVAPSPNESVLKEVGDGMAAAILAQSGARYTSQRAAQLYPTTGSTDDWYTEQGGMWGWTIELRDEGRYGFRLPADQIKPTGEENWAAFKYLADQVWRRGPPASTKN